MIIVKNLFKFKISAVAENRAQHVYLSANVMEYVKADKFKETGAG